MLCVVSLAVRNALGKLMYGVALAAERSIAGVLAVCLIMHSLGHAWLRLGVYVAHCRIAGS